MGLGPFPVWQDAAQKDSLAKSYDESFRKRSRRTNETGKKRVTDFDPSTTEMFVVGRHQ